MEDSLPHMTVQLLIFASFILNHGVFGQGKNSLQLQCNRLHPSPPFFAHARYMCRSGEEEHNVHLRTIVAEMRLATGGASRRDQRERGVRERRSETGTRNRCQSWEWARCVERCAATVVFFGWGFVVVVVVCLFVCFVQLLCIVLCCASV